VQEIRKLFSDFLDGQVGRGTYRSVWLPPRTLRLVPRELDEWQSMQARLRALPRRQVPGGAGSALASVGLTGTSPQPAGPVLGQDRERTRALVAACLAGVLNRHYLLRADYGCTSSACHHPTGRSCPASHTAACAHGGSPDLKMDDDVVVLTHINSGGRVTTTSSFGSRNSGTMQRLDEVMYFLQRFDPATTFGQPTDGRVILSLRRLTVRG